MEAGQLIFSLLSSAPDVVALSGTRIYPLRVPQGKPRPAIAYQLVSNVNDGEPGCYGDDRPRVQVSLFADTYATLCALSAATRAALDGYRSGAIVVTHVNETDLYDEQAECFHRPQDYEVEAPRNATVPA